MNANQFANALRILRNIDQFEVKFLTTSQWPKFRDDPYVFMMRADGPTLEKIWAIVESRQPKVKS